MREEGREKEDVAIALKGIDSKIMEKGNYIRHIWEVVSTGFGS